MCFIRQMLVMTFIKYVSCAENHHVVYWNTSNIEFQTEQALEVTEGNQVHIVCPNNKEQHLVHLVSQSDFNKCSLSRSSRVVMVCDKRRPGQYRSFTIRPYSPTPGGLEFNPGQEYFLVSTSSTKNVHQRRGGFCSSHNMRLLLHVSEQVRPTVRPSSEFIYYYTARDLLTLQLRGNRNKLKKLTGNIDTSQKAARISTSSSSSDLSLYSWWLILLTILMIKI